jgi:hypothetical protein
MVLRGQNPRFLGYAASPQKTILEAAKHIRDRRTGYGLESDLREALGARRRASATDVITVFGGRVES